MNSPFVLIQSLNASLDDVLRFRRALSFMDEKYPFGTVFGPAATRNECISSSQALFEKLVRLGESKSAVDFEILAVIAVDDDGNSDPMKKRTLRRLFRPDMRNQLPLLAFVASCDSVYKRLRYFRASVSNSSVIDQVLVSIVDGIFYFVLSLVLLSFMQFNPWPLLVSISSLLVVSTEGISATSNQCVIP